MSSLRRIVVDVLKPHDPPLLEFTEQLADLQSAEGINATLIELDREVQNVEIAAEGTNIQYDRLEERIEDLGGAVHSIDQVAYGEHVVEDHGIDEST